MSRKTTGLTALQTQKQLLVLESELNRTQLVGEWHEVKAGLDHVTSQLTAVGSMATSAAKIGTSFAGFFRGYSDETKKTENKKPSLIANIFNGARAGISLWSALGSRSREQK